MIMAVNQLTSKGKEDNMSITIDLPLASAQKAREYVTVPGTTLERSLLDYLAAELKR